MNTMQKIMPSLWFDQDTEDAVNFYTDIFNGSPHKGGDSNVMLKMKKIVIADLQSAFDQA